MEKARDEHKSAILISTVTAVLLALAVIIIQVKRVADGFVEADSDYISGVIILVFIAILPMLLAILVNLRVLNSTKAVASIVGPIMLAFVGFILMIICFSVDYTIGFGRYGRPDDAMLMSGILMVLHLFSVYPFIKTLICCLNTYNNGYIYK